MARASNRIEYFKNEIKQLIFQMLVIFVICPHLVHYWLIFTVQSMCPSILVDIYNVSLIKSGWAPLIYIDFTARIVYTVDNISSPTDMCSHICLGTEPFSD